MTESRITVDVDAAADVLRRGGLVAFPTETVYGLGADAASSTAVRGIFAAKGRPTGHPLIVHVAAADDVDAWCAPDARQAVWLDRLAAAFWPGPLTLILPRNNRVAPEAVGDRRSIGLRVPDHPVATALLTTFGGGVAAPSANRFGRVSPTTAAHVAADLGPAVELILDGGSSRVGLESTIVELTGSAPTLLRPGGVTAAAVAEVLGVEVVDGRSGPSRASGMLASHYAPDATVSITGLDAVDREVATLTAGGANVGVIAPESVGVRPSWVLPSDADAYGHELYAALRRVDAEGLDHVLIVPPEHGDLLAAVLDRLAKAAGPRPAG